MKYADADAVWKILSAFLYHSACCAVGCHSLLKNFRVSILEKQYTIFIRELTSFMKHKIHSVLVLSF